MSNAQELRNQKEELMNQTMKKNLTLFTKCFENKAYIFNLLKGNYADQFTQEYQEAIHSDTPLAQQNLMDKFNEIIDSSVDNTTKWEAIKAIMDYKLSVHNLTTNSCDLVTKQQTKHKSKKLPAVQYKYFLEADLLSKYYETSDLPRCHRYWEALETVLDGVTALLDHDKQTKINRQKEWNKFSNHLLSNSDSTYKEKIVSYVEHYFDHFAGEFNDPLDVYNRVNNTKTQNIKQILHMSKQPDYRQSETMDQIQHRCDQIQQSNQPMEYKAAINIATLNQLKAYPIAKRLAADRKLKMVRRKDVTEAEVLVSFYEDFDKITNPKQQLRDLKKLIRFASNASKISGNPKQFGDRHTLKQHVKNPLNIHK